MQGTSSMIPLDSLVQFFIQYVITSYINTAINVLLCSVHWFCIRLFTLMYLILWTLSSRKYCYLDCV